MGIMKERIVQTEQLRKPVNVPVTGLTPDINTLYAGSRGVLFMPNESGGDMPQDQTNNLGTNGEKTVDRPVTVSVNPATGTLEGQTGAFRVDVTKGIESSYQNSEEILKYWKNELAEHKDDKVYEEFKKAGFSAETFAALQITPADFLKNKQFYTEYADLFKKGITKEEIQKKKEKWSQLKKRWKDHFAEHMAEYLKKEPMINSIIIQLELDPEGFAAAYNWSAFFSMEFKKRENVFVEGAKLFFKEVSKLNKESEEIQRQIARERQIAFARVLWWGIKERRREENQALLEDEQRIMGWLGNQGIEPEKYVDKKHREERKLEEKPAIRAVLNNASIKDDTKRIERLREDISRYNSTMTEEKDKFKVPDQETDEGKLFNQSVINAHKIGTNEPGIESEAEAGVYNYRVGQIYRKVKELQRGVTDPKLRRFILEHGYAGEARDEDEIRKLLSLLTVESLNEEQLKVFREDEELLKLFLELNPQGIEVVSRDPMLQRKLVRWSQEGVSIPKETPEEESRKFASQYQSGVELIKLSGELEDFVSRSGISNKKILDLENNPELHQRLINEAKRIAPNWDEETINAVIAGIVEQKQLQIKSQKKESEEKLGKKLSGGVPASIQEGETAKTSEKLTHDQLTELWNNKISQLRQRGIPIGRDDLKDIAAEIAQGKTPDNSTLGIMWNLLEKQMGPPSPAGAGGSGGQPPGGGIIPPAGGEPPEPPGGGDNPPGASDSGNRRDRERGNQPGRREKKEGKKSFSTVTMWERIQQEVADYESKLRESDLRNNYQSEEEYEEAIEDRKTVYREQVEQQLFNNNTPNNLEDVAWQIGYSNPGKYGVSGEFPVLEVRDKKGKLITNPNKLFDRENEITVNKANYIRWIRERMMWFHSQGPDEAYDFSRAVMITKNYRPIALDEMVNNPTIYFKSAKDARVQEELKERKRVAQRAHDQEAFAEIQKEEEELSNRVNKEGYDEKFLGQVIRQYWLFGADRGYDINYRLAMGNGGDLEKTVKQMFGNSTFTKTSFDKSTMYWVMTDEQNYGSDKTRDMRVGAGTVTSYLAYYYLTDVEKLREILGDNATLLSKEKLTKVRDQQAGVKESDAPDIKATKRNEVLSDKDIAAIFSGANGAINEEQFVRKLNIFQSPKIPLKLTKLVRQSIQNDIAHKYKIYLPPGVNGSYMAEGQEGVEPQKQPHRVDTETVAYADQFAFSMVRWSMAAARNNLTAAGYDYGGKMYAETYRRKQAGGDYAGSFGISYTVPQFKMLWSDFMTSTKTVDGIPTLQALTDLHSAYNTIEWDSAEKQADEAAEQARREHPEDPFAAQEAWKHTFGELTSGGLQKADAAAGKLLFTENEMRQWSYDWFGRGREIFEQVVDAKEIKLEKFTHTDNWKGVTFEREPFQEAINEHLVKPLRYFLRTWKDAKFDQMVRVNTGSEMDVHWEDKSLAEAMFGDEVLDCPEFWEQPTTLPDGMSEKPKKPKENDPEYKNKMKKYNSDFAKYKKHAEANGYVQMNTRAKEGEWEITFRKRGTFSAKEVEDNRDQLVRQIAKVRIAAELYAHVDLYSTDPRYDFRFYETIINALESIPGGILGDDKDLKSAKADKNPMNRFLSPEDINWIRRKSNTTRGWLFLWAVLSATASGLQKGTIEMVTGGVREVMSTVAK